MPIVTAVKVVDASALAALILDEPDAKLIADQLQGVRAVAPALLGFELTNVLQTRCRREPHRRDDLVEAFRLRTRLKVEDKPVDHDAVLALALATGLSAYDASYLWLSRHLGAELVTLDRRLMTEAARSS